MHSMSSDSVKKRSSSSCARRRSMNMPICCADGREHRQQLVVRLADLAAEELHHAEHFAAQQDWEAERGVQALAQRPPARGKFSDRSSRARRAPIRAPRRSPRGFSGAASSMVVASRRAARRDILGGESPLCRPAVEGLIVPGMPLAETVGT